MDFINSSYVERCRPSLRRSSHDFSSFYTAAAECSSFSRPHTQSSFISEFVPAREQLEEKDFCFVCTDGMADFKSKDLEHQHIQRRLWMVKQLTTYLLHAPDMLRLATQKNL